MAFGDRGRRLGACDRFCMGTLQRQRRSGKLELSSEALAPEPDARATGRALDARDLISCIAGVLLFISPRILGSPDIAVSWLGHDLPPSSMLPGEPQGLLTAG